MHVRRHESQKCRIVTSPEDLQKARLDEPGKTWACGVDGEAGCVRPDPPAELTRCQSQGKVTSGE